MDSVITPHRKLIDIKPAVFDSLSLEAARKGVSLKHFIEDLLEKACPRNEQAPEGISRLIGSALPRNKALSEIDDDRLQYLLSK
ncbi:MAG: hypothetical protein J5835_01980 [Bacteroidales bacterium]|nr:hypothetical protein [Bacteroidales bacterium]